MLRYFYRIFILTITALLCFKRKKSKRFGVLSPDPQWGCLQHSSDPSCHFACLWHVCFYFRKNPMRPYFSSALSPGWGYSIKQMQYSMLVRCRNYLPPVRYTALSCWIYLPRVTNYLGNKFLILNKKDWNICLIFRSFQVLNSISKKQTDFKQKSYLFRYWNQLLMLDCSSVILLYHFSVEPVKYLLSCLTPGILIFAQVFFLVS